MRQRNAVLAAMLLTGWAGGALAQMAETEQERLLQRPAAGVQQEGMATHVGRVCPNLTPATDPADPVNALIERCSNLVVGSRAEANDDLTRSGLDAMAGEEVIAIEAGVDGVIARQTAAIGGRISALSRRIGTGAVASRFGPLADGAEIAGSDSFRVAQDGSTISLETTSGLGIYLTGGYNFGNSDPVRQVDEEISVIQEQGYEFDVFSVTAGLDYFLTDTLIIGASAGYDRTDIGLDAGAGSLDGNGFTVAAYGLFNPAPELTLSLLGAFSRVSYDQSRTVDYVEIDRDTGDRRRINDKLASEPVANQFEVTAALNYDFSFGSWMVGPSATLSYLDSTVGAYSERAPGANNEAIGLELNFDDLNNESLQTWLGVQGGRAFSTSTGVLTLQGRALWVHEYLDSARDITYRFVNSVGTNATDATLRTAEPDRDRALFGIGASFVGPGGITAYADFETVAFHEGIDSYTITVGARLEF